MSGQSKKMMAPYQKIPRGRCADREGFLLETCTGRRVVHVACAAWPATKQWCEDGSLLHLRLAGVADELAGLDLSAEGLEILEGERVGELLCVDLLDRAALGQAWSQLSFQPDVVVVGEILEHIDSPGLLLRNLRDSVDASTQVVVTVPSAWSLRGIFHAVRGVEKVAPDHVAYYSPSTISELLTRSGFVVEDLRWYLRSGPIGGTERLVRGLLAPLLALQPQWGEGIIASCRAGSPAES